MPGFIEDFIKCGKCEHCSEFFDNDVLAVKLSAGISKSQVRKYRRYEQVPSAFVKYLQEVGVVFSNQDTNKSRSVLDVLDILWENMDKANDCNLIQFLREKLLNEIFPGLRGASCTQCELWEKIINSKISKRREAITLKD